LVIWDTAGQERFKSIAKSYFNKSDGVILVFDLTSIESFNSIENWMEDIKKEDRNSVILLGNKCDIKDRIIIQKEMIEKLVKKHNIKYFETSAKENKNIKKSFESLAKNIFNKKYNVNKGKQNNKEPSQNEIYNLVHNFVNYY